MKGLFKNCRRKEIFNESSDFFGPNKRAFRVLGIILTIKTILSVNTIIILTSGYSIWNRGWKYNLYRLYTLLLCLFIWTFMMWHLIKNLMESNLERALQNITISMLHVTSLIKFSSMALNHKKYNELMKFINSRSFENDNETCNQLRKKAFERNRDIVFGFICFGLSALFMFEFFPLFQPKKVFTVPVYFPLDFDKHYQIYYLFYLLIVLAAVPSVLLAGLGCIFMCSVMHYLSVEFKILGMSFEDALNQFDDQFQNIDKTQTKVTNNIKHHIILLE